jgi:hypothetical protein
MFKVFKIIKTNRGIKSNPSNLDGKMNPLGFFFFILEIIMIKLFFKSKFLKIRVFLLSPISFIIIINKLGYEKKII